MQALQSLGEVQIGQVAAPSAQIFVTAHIGDADFVGVGEGLHCICSRAKCEGRMLAIGGAGDP